MAKGQLIRSPRRRAVEAVLARRGQVPERSLFPRCSAVARPAGGMGKGIENVRFESGANIPSTSIDVRFAPESGHSCA
jgi:hypothetical protein